MTNHLNDTTNMYHALYGNLSPWSVISNESSISEKIAKSDTLNRELNKLYRFL